MLLWPSSGETDVCVDGSAKGLLKQCSQGLARAAPARQHDRFLQTPSPGAIHVWRRGKVVKSIHTFLQLALCSGHPSILHSSLQKNAPWSVLLQLPLHLIQRPMDPQLKHCTNGPSVANLGSTSKSDSSKPPPGMSTHSSQMSLKYLAMVNLRDGV